MIKLASLIEWKKYSVSHSDPTAAEHRSLWAIDNEPWRGPHTGSELELMLRNKKPVASIGTNKEYEKFLPYIKRKRFILKKDITGGWLVAQPNEAWRIDKIINLFNSKEYGPKYHAKLGILFGYSKDDILQFIRSFKY